MGVATGGIAQGALVAQELGLPFAYVRSEKKAHGLTNQIEGVVEAGQTAVIIEDLISTGGSSLNAVQALRDVGVYVKGMVAIFNYGLPVSVENFKKADCELTSLTDYETLLAKALDENYLTEDEIISLKEWQSDPQKWSSNF